MNPGKVAEISGEGILVVDLYGVNEYSAKPKVDAALASAGPEIRCIRLAHGMIGAAPVYLMLHNTYSNHPRVAKLELSKDAGYTELTLREGGAPCEPR